MQKLIIPTVDNESTFFNWANRFLPLVTPIQLTSLNDASARKPDKAGLQIGQHLHHVRSQAARAILPGVLWEQRDHVEIDGAISFEEHIKLCVSIGFIRVQHTNDLLPLGRRSR